MTVRHFATILGLAFVSGSAEAAEPRSDAPHTLDVKAEVCAFGSESCMPLPLPATVRNGTLVTKIEHIPTGSHLYVVAISPLGDCGWLFPRGVTDREHNPVQRAELHLPVHGVQRARPNWRRIHVVALSFRLETYDEPVVCELAKAHQTLDSYLARYQAPNATWAHLFRKLRADKTRPFSRSPGEGGKGLPSGVELPEPPAHYGSIAKEGEVASATLPLLAPQNE